MKDPWDDGEITRSAMTSLPSVWIVGVLFFLSMHAFFLNLEVRSSVASSLMISSRG